MTITRRCTRCDEDRWVELFRVLASGWRSSMCDECELAYDRERHYRRNGRPVPVIILAPDVYALASEPSEEFEISDRTERLALALDLLDDDGRRCVIRSLCRRFGWSVQIEGSADDRLAFAFDVLDREAA